MSYYFIPMLKFSGVIQNFEIVIWVYEGKIYQIVPIATHR
jgi:hypothetical protein